MTTNRSETSGKSSYRVFDDSGLVLRLLEAICPAAIIRLVALAVNKSVDGAPRWRNPHCVKEVDKFMPRLAYFYSFCTVVLVFWEVGPMASANHGLPRSVCRTQLSPPAVAMNDWPYATTRLGVPVEQVIDDNTSSGPTDALANGFNVGSPELGFVDYDPISISFANPNDSLPLAPFRLRQRVRPLHIANLKPDAGINRSNRLGVIRHLPHICEESIVITPRFRDAGGSALERFPVAIGPAVLSPASVPVTGDAVGSLAPTGSRVATEQMNISGDKCGSAIASYFGLANLFSASGQRSGCIFANCELSKPPTDDINFSRHNVASLKPFNVVFSSGAQRQLNVAANSSAFLNLSQPETKG